MTKPHNGKYINCLECKTQFYVPLYRTDKAKFCSRLCHSKNSSMNLENTCQFCNKTYKVILYRQNTSKYCSAKCYNLGKIKPFPKFNCVHCGKEFVDHKRNKNRKYCSRSCITKSEMKTWKPSYSAIRKRLQVRGKITQCENCKYDLHPEILGVHHIDENRKNNRIENLIVLCPNCHSVEHRKHIVH